VIKTGEDRSKQAALVFDEGSLTSCYTSMQQSALKKTEWTVEGKQRLLTIANLLSTQVITYYFSYV
jgi:hypothetical protein